MPTRTLKLQGGIEQENVTTILKSRQHVCMQQGCRLPWLPNKTKMPIMCSCKANKLPDLREHIEHTHSADASTLPLTNNVTTAKKERSTAAEKAASVLYSL